MEEVILVDEHDREIGTGEKLKTHREGRLHRAFSIFVFNRDGMLLLQKRAKAKYHSGGLWSNTCCGHPRPGELTAEAAHRRLREEMNFSCELRKLFAFTYRVELGNQLCEFEYDHVFVGEFNGASVPNELEVEDLKWVSVDVLAHELNNNPLMYTYWLKVAFDKMLRPAQSDVKGKDENLFQRLFKE